MKRKAARLPKRAAFLVCVFLTQDAGGRSGDAGQNADSNGEARSCGVTPQLLVFPALGLLPRTDDPHGALVGSVIRQDEDGHGQAADEEDGVHGALSVEVSFLVEAYSDGLAFFPCFVGRLR